MVRKELYETVMKWFITETDNEKTNAVQRTAFKESTNELCDLIMSRFDVSEKQKKKCKTCNGSGVLSLREGFCKDCKGTGDLMPHC